MIPPPKSDSCQPEAQVRVLLASPRFTIDTRRVQTAKAHDQSEGATEQRQETAALSIFIYHPELIFLLFVAFRRKFTKPLEALVLLIVVCFQRLCELALCEFESPHPDHF